MKRDFSRNKQKEMLRELYPKLLGVKMSRLSFCPAGDATRSCDVTVEPVSLSQRLLPEPVEVCVKGVLQGWDGSSLTHTFTESWVLRCSNGGAWEAVAFQHLLMELSARALHMVRRVVSELRGCDPICDRRSPLVQP